MPSVRVPPMGLESERLLYRAGHRGGGPGRKPIFVNLYGLFDPTEPDELRYIGTTQYLVGERLKQHVAEAAAAIGTHKRHWIAGLLGAGRRPNGRCLAVIEDDEASRTEQRAIGVYKNSGHRLTNSTEGGDRVVFTKETRSRMSASANARWDRPGEREKLSAAHITPEARENHIAAAKTRAARPGESERRSAAHRTPEARVRQSKASKAMWARPGERERASMARKAVWARPGQRAKQSKAIRAARARMSAEVERKKDDMGVTEHGC